MTNTEIIAQIRSELVEPVQGFWTDEELLLWLDRAQNDFLGKTRNLEDRDFTSTQNGVMEYPIPDNCLSVRAVFLNIATTGQTPNWRRLKPTNLEKNAQEVPNFMGSDSSQLGTPASYMIWGRSIYLFPIPNTNGSNDIAVFFKAKPISVTETNQPLSVDNSLHDGLIAYVLWKAYAKEKDKDAADEQKQIYDSYILEGRKWQKKQSGDQRYRLDVSSPTPIEGPYDQRFNPLA